MFQRLYEIVSTFVPGLGRAGNRELRRIRDLALVLFLPVWVIGAVAPVVFDSPWPALVSAIFCGYIWFLVVGRATVLAFMVDLIPQKWVGEIGIEKPEALKPGKINYFVSTVGHWALLPLLASVTFPIYHSWLLYLTFQLVVVVILYFVLTQEPDIKFWRKVYGYSFTVIVILPLLFRVSFPGTYDNLVAKFNYYEGVQQTDADRIKARTADVKVRLAELDKLDAYYNAAWQTHVLDDNGLNNQYDLDWPKKNTATWKAVTRERNKLEKSLLSLADMNDREEKNWLLYLGIGALGLIYIGGKLS